MPSVAILGGGFRRTTRYEGVGVSYSAEATALFARFTTPPSAARKVVINNLIVALKAAGVWSKLVAFYVLAAADAQAAQRNWISDTFNLTPVNSPVFAADLGYTGDASTSYLSTGFNQSTDGGALYLRDSAALGFGSRTSATNNNADIGNANARVAAAVVANTMNSRINGSTSLTVSNADGSGRFYVARNASSTIRPYKNGSPLTAETANTSTALENSVMRMLGIGGAGLQFSARQEWFGLIGAGLSAAEIAAADAAILIYGQAVGAA